MLVNIIVIFIVGVVTGFINVNAGGGSLLTMPILIFMGLPPAVANGTNRIAILAGAVSATATFKKKGYFDWKFALELGIPALIGALIGSAVAVSIPDELFKAIFSVIMVVVLAVIIINPQGKIKRSIEDLSAKRRIVTAVAFFFIGIYGGLIQAGVGFLIIASLSLITGLSLVKINALKVFVVLLYTILSISVFLFHGKINIPIGFSLAAGSAFGAYLGSHFAIAKGDKWIRVILVISVVAMAIKLSGIFGN